MLTRRSFSLTLLGALGSTSFSIGEGLAQQSEFICATKDPEYVKFEIENFSANEVNRPKFEQNRQEFAINDFGVAQLAHRWRRSDGNTPNSGKIALGVGFLNGDSGQHERFKSAVKNWADSEVGQYISFDFAAPADKRQIRVTFDAKGNWSYVGRGNLSVAKSAPTMNLQNMQPDVIIHEMGHALGLQHEHNHPRANIAWDKVVVKREMAALGWSDADCETNIFAKYDDRYVCVGSPNFDKHSIMIYPIPTRWTKNGFSATPSSNISEGDRKCLQGLYSA
jgi:hypothetical protein